MSSISQIDRYWSNSSTIEVNVGIICSCLMLMPAFLDRHLPDSVKSSAARLWSSIVQNLFFRRSSNTSKAEPNSGGRAKKWITFKQKSDSDSQQQVIMNDITTATYQVPSNSNYEANYWTDSIDSQRRDYQKPTSQNRTGEVWSCSRPGTMAYKGIWGQYGAHSKPWPWGWSVGVGDRLMIGGVTQHWPSLYTGRIQPGWVTHMLRAAQYSNENQIDETTQPITPGVSSSIWICILLGVGGPEIGPSVLEVGLGKT